MKNVLVNTSMMSVATAIILSMTGCGGGGGGSSTPAGATPTTTSGKASDGYISGATVCFDMDLDGNCTSADGLVTTTDVNGTYSLVVSVAQKAAAKPNAPLLLVGGTDVDTKAALVGTLKAPFDASAASVNTQLTPLTTLVSAMVEKNVPVDTAYSRVAKALNLTLDEVKADPVKLAEDGNTTVIQAAMTIHRVVTTMAKAADVDNSDIYGSLVTAISTVAADSNETNTSIVDIVTEAVKDNSTLPKESTQIAKAIETTITTAVNSGKTIQETALVSDYATDILQTAIENNTTINDTFVKSLEQNASSASPIKIAVKNLLESYLSYGANLTDTDIDSIITAGNFGTSSEVTPKAIIALSGNTTIDPNILSDFSSAYNVQQIKLYVEKYGQTVTPDMVAKIAAVPGIDYESLKTMSLANFSKKIYDYGMQGDGDIEGQPDVDLISLALKLSPPADIASLSDIDKAKHLFESVRTQVNKADTFTQEESTNIDAALNSVAGNVEFTTTVFNTLNDMISQAIDTNQTVSRTVDNGDRNITVSKADASTTGNAVWDYTIKDTNVTNPWTGSVSYTDVDPDTFDPSSFTTLTAKITGALPLDYHGVTIPEGKENSQNVDANLKIDKTDTGAKFNLNATIVNNGDSVSITDANILVAYTTKTNDDGTKEPMLSYVEVQKLNINGTVGNYTLDGKFDVKSYVVNAIGEAKGFDTQTTYNSFGVDAHCPNNDGNITTNVLFKGSPSNFYENPNDIYIHVYDFKGILTQDDLIDINNYVGIPTDCNLSVNYSYSWTDDDFENSGHIPSEITFDGTLTNDVNSTFLNAKIDAKWTNIVDANISSDDYIANIDVTVAGTLAMPESPVMNVGLEYTNKGLSKTVNVTYVNDGVSINANSTFNDVNDAKTINLSSTAGIEAKIVLDENNSVDYKKSTVTNTVGETVGKIEDRAGGPVVVYADGTFESLF